MEPLIRLLNMQQAAYEAILLLTEHAQDCTYQEAILIEDERADLLREVESRYRQIETAISQAQADNSDEPALLIAQKKDVLMSLVDKVRLLDLHRTGKIKQQINETRIKINRVVMGSHATYQYRKAHYLSTHHHTR